MKIIKFEDLDVWKESRILVNIVYDLTVAGNFSRDFGLKEQIQRAAVSCMLNVAEGFDSGSNLQFIQYLVYTRRSSSEVQSVAYIALDRKYIKQQDFELVYEQSKKVAKLSNGFIRYLKSCKSSNRITG